MSRTYNAPIPFPGDLESLHSNLWHPFLAFGHLATTSYWKASLLKVGPRWADDNHKMHFARKAAFDQRVGYRSRPL